MLQFFRHIRNRLVRTQQTRKYLVYALGEVLLVMVGILLALQVSTWNQNRINARAEQRILESIQEELQLQFFLLRNGKIYENRSIQASKALLEWIHTEDYELSQDSLLYYCYQLTRRWMTGTQTNIYDALIGSGELGLISSETLRNDLAEYKSNLEFLAIFENLKAQFVNDQLTPYLNRSTDRLNNPTSGMSDRYDLPASRHESNFQSMRENRYFSNLLYDLIKHTNPVVSTYQRMNMGLFKLDSMVTVELKQ